MGHIIMSLTVMANADGWEAIEEFTKRVHESAREVFGSDYRVLTRTEKQEGEE